MSRTNRTPRTTAARRRRRKPVLVKAGSVAVKIRQSPLLINGKKYPSFVVDYYANGKRYRDRKAYFLQGTVLRGLARVEIDGQAFNFQHGLCVCSHKSAIPVGRIQ